jgi:hypothetical protein
VIDSTPAPTTIGTPSTMIRPAAVAIAFRPEEQWRLTVMPVVVTGQPALSETRLGRSHVRSPDQMMLSSTAQPDFHAAASRFRTRRKMRDFVGAA